MERRRGYTAQVAALTHVGRLREGNEDCIAVARDVTARSSLEVRSHRSDLESPLVCLVADGLGGHPCGDVASRLAAERLAVDLPAVFPSEAEIARAIGATHDALIDAMAADRGRVGMGTTVAGVVLDAHTALAFSVGDSRVYRIHAQGLSQVTVDDACALSVPFMSFSLPVRSLSQCLGGFPGGEPPVPHVLPEPMADGSGWLICSDGLHDMLSLDAMTTCMDDDPDRMVSELFDRAMEAGGRDNISIVVVRLVEAG